MTGPLAVRVHDLPQARAVLARWGGSGTTLVTAEGSAGFAGVGYWREVERALGTTVVVDCGGDAGLALAALRAGCRDLLFTGPEGTAARLGDIAGQLGGQVRRALDGPVLALLPGEEPAARGAFATAAADVRSAPASPARQQHEGANPCA